MPAGESRRPSVAPGAGSAPVRPTPLPATDVLLRERRRADYLQALTRDVSSLAHPARAVELFTSSLVDEVADLAQVVIRTHQGWVAAAQARGQQMVDVHSYEVGRAQARVLTQMMQARVTERWVLPPDTRRRAEMLQHLFGGTELREHVEALGPACRLLSLPLVARGRSVGLVTLALRGPGAFDESTTAFLEEVAHRIAVSLDACSVVADNRHVAGALRRSLLPPPVERTSRVDVASYSRVAREDITVGGDFIDVHGPVDDQTLLLGDAVGKGVVAAIAAKRIRGAVRTAALVDRDPAWMMALTNRRIMGEEDELVERFATAVCGRLQVQDDRLRVTLVVAGHPPPIVLRRDGSVELVEAHGPALGLFEDAEYDSVVLELEAGDLLVCYTDGVTEARGDGELFGEERIVAALQGLAGAPAGAAVETIAMAVSSFVVDEDERDDTAIVALRLLPADERARDEAHP